MTNKISHANLPGRSVTVRLINAVTAIAQGAAFALPATAVPEVYAADTPGGTPAGTYIVVVYVDGQFGGSGIGRYSGSAWLVASAPEEVPSAIHVAAAVRTNLATELARMDLAISTRAAPGAAMALTPAERTALAAVIEAALLADGDGQAFVNAIVAAIGNTNVNQGVLIAAIRADLERVGGMLDALPLASEIVTAVDASTQLAKASAVTTLQTTAAAIKAKTDLLPAAPAAVSNIPTAAQVAAAVRADQAVELERINVPLSTLQTEASAASRAATNQAEHDATQTTLASGTIRADVRAVNGTPLQGTGAANNKWRPA